MTRWTGYDWVLLSRAEAIDSQRGKPTVYDTVSARRIRALGLSELLVVLHKCPPYILFKYWYIEVRSILLRERALFVNSLCFQRSRSYLVGACGT